MADVNLHYPADTISGKTSKNDSGYYYKRNGKQFYRTRDESYHKRHTPKQKWVAQAFAYAQTEMLARFSSPEAIAQMEQDYQTALHIGANGKPAPSAHAWQFGMLQFDWKLAHPFESWYAAYIQSISDTAASKTAAESVSDHMLRQQINLLLEQVEQLRSILS